MQEISLEFLEKAVNFLHVQKSEEIFNVSRETETLLKGAALIVSSGSQDAMPSSGPSKENSNKERAKVIKVECLLWERMIVITQLQTKTNNL